MHADSTSTLAAASTPSLECALRAIVGDAHVSSDPATRALHSEDIWSVSPHTAALIVSPGSTAEVVAVMKVAFAVGVPVAPRGAAMSYTSSHLPTSDTAISLDMCRMDQVIAVNAVDMTVTVGPGCTWAALNDALSPLGLRTPFWGPMSGLASTIGGGISQLNAMLGGGQHGTSSESVIAMTVVLADGSLVATGARGEDGQSPFYRHFGPDLTGIFCGDSGTLGIKTEIVMRLMTMPAHEDYASFSFPTGEAMLRALADVVRAGIACETCGFDPGLTRVRLKRMSLAADFKALGSVIARQKSLSKGLMSAARMALGGRNFIESEEYSLHLNAEGRSAAGVAADIAEMQRIAAEHGGRAIENTIAKMIRAVPFPPLNSMLGPEGEAWAPVHGIMPLSRAPAIFAELQALFAEFAPAFEQHGVFTGYLFTSVSTNAIMIEPVFYWPHGWRPIHEVHIQPAHLARLTHMGTNAAASAVVADAKQRVVDLYARHGCAHYQIGRTYRYRESRDEGSRHLLDAIKAAVDPGHQLNPGGLGFGTDQAG